jgi:hypothetical protein
MNEKRLYLICIAAALTGLLLLLIFPESPGSFFHAQAKCYGSAEIRGKITSVQQKGTTSIISIEQNITLIAFQQLNKDIIGKNAKITARLSEYKGKKEVIAEEIKS